MVKTLPRARTQDLVVQNVNEETLVYDQKCQQAHCLNRLASLVWQHCDGRTTHEDMAQRLGREAGIRADTQVVEVVLQDLDQAGLLAEPLKQKSMLSRRELAARLGAGAAFLLAPMVTSIVTQSAMAQASPIRPPPTTAPPTTTTTTTTSTTTQVPE